MTEKLKVHPLGPVMVAVIAVIAWFVVKELGGGQLGANMGAGQGIGYNYGSQFSAVSDESPGSFILPFYGNLAHEYAHTHPVVEQGGKKVPFYNFINEYYHSQEGAYLTERNIP